MSYEDLKITRASRPNGSSTDPTCHHAPRKSNLETEHIPPKNYRRSLLAIAELIKAIVEEMSEQEVEQSSSQQQFADELPATDL